MTVVRRHRWMVYAPFDVTAEDGLRLLGEMPMEGADRPPAQLAADDVPALDDQRPWLGLHNLNRELMVVGCYDCEQPLTGENAHTACPGQPSGELAYVDAQGRRSADDTALAAPPGAGQVRHDMTAVGRNEPCPCGSGQKFKRCHGA